MRMYYYEFNEAMGGPYRFQAESDAKAIESMKDVKNLLILYRESDTEDGTSFVTLWERAESPMKEFFTGNWSDSKVFALCCASSLFGLTWGVLIMYMILRN